MTTRPDPRGPVKTAVRVFRTSRATLVTLSCGHVASLASHFTYRVGRDYHCYTCGRMELIEFNREQRA